MKSAGAVSLEVPTQKIMAASKSLYMKLKGSSADSKHAIVEVDLTHATEGVPRTKKACCNQSEEKSILILEWLDRLGASLEQLEYFLDFVRHLMEA